MTALVDEPTRVPVLLPHLRIEVGLDGELAATLGREAYDVPAEWAHLGRDAVARLVKQVVAQLESPVRVDVTDGGATFTDIFTPSDAQDGELTPSPAPTAPLVGEVAGIGFSPGESVAIAVVVALQVADAAGKAKVRLPPTLLASGPGVVLLGTSSGAVAASGSVT